MSDVEKLQQQAHASAISLACLDAHPVRWDPPSDAPGTVGPLSLNIGEVALSLLVGTVHSSLSCCLPASAQVWRVRSFYSACSYQ